MKRTLLFAVCLTAISAQAQNQNTAPVEFGAAEMAPSVVNKPTEGSKALWDIEFSHDVTTESGQAGQAGVAFINNEFWTSRWASDTMIRYTSTGTLISSFTIPGITGARSITSDGTNVYIGNATNTIYVVDPGTQLSTSTITSSSVNSSRFLAYDATLDGGSGGFWTGNFNTDIDAIDMSGNVLSTITVATHGLGGMYGAAADVNATGGPILWVFHQGGTNQSEMTALSLPSGTPVGISHDVFPDISTTYSLNSALAGGAFITTDYSVGQTSLVCLAQGDPNNVIVVYDAEMTASVIEQTSNELSIYPVPAAGSVTVELENALTENGVVNVYDLAGKLVVSQNINAGTNTFKLDLATVETGVYTVSVQSSRVVINKQISVR